MNVTFCILSFLLPLVVVGFVQFPVVPSNSARSSEFLRRVKETESILFSVSENVPDASPTVPSFESREDSAVVEPDVESYVEGTYYY